MNLPPPISDQLVIEQGQTLEVPFAVGEAKDAELSAAASSDNAEYTVEAILSEIEPATGIVKVTAPEFILSPVTVNISLEITDAKTARTVCASIVLASKLVDGFAEISTPANCYIVSPGALVKFPANIGNTADKAKFISVSLVWQDAQGLVKSLIPAPEEGCIYAVLGEGISGNALVAAVGEDGAAAWSYHLWVCDYDPEASVMTYEYTKGETPRTFKMMDRHIGALNVDPSSELSSGLFYQWGRKDPFGSSDHAGSLRPLYNISNELVNKYHDDEEDFDYFGREVVVCDQADNIPTATANPGVHYDGINTGNWSWLTNDKATMSKDENQDLWGGVSGIQTKYDPCPAGWRVAPAAAWYFASDADVEKAKVFPEGLSANKDLLGRSATINGATFYFPAQGEVTRDGEYKNGIGTTWPCGKSWTSQMDVANYRAWGTNYTPTSFSYSAGYSLGYELSVRCIKAE